MMPVNNDLDRTETRELACAAALTWAESLGPPRLRRVLAEYSPAEAHHRLSLGHLPDAPRLLRPRTLPVSTVLANIRAELASIDPAWCLDRVRALGDMVVLGRPGYPDLLVDDIDPPPVLFFKGDLGALDARRVTIVGTRSATKLGCTVAHDIGADLADAGVTVVSGLAAGIDAAAHLGAVGSRGRPIGVVGSGLDIAYPRTNATLWKTVADTGLLLTEAHPGASPKPWRFPQRNRILAALGELVVVVESRGVGGSIITVDEAVKRGRTVCAVPGSVRSPASEGTNQLLTEGRTPVRDGLDVLTVLGLETMGPLRFDARPEPDDLGSEVLAHLGSGSQDFGGLVELTGSEPVQVARSLGWLEAAGWIRSDRGWFDIAPAGR